MQREGLLAPETDEEARVAFAELAPAAQEVTRSVALTIGIDRDEYRDTVDEAVVRTAHEVLFGSLLRVRTADRNTFDEWVESEAAGLDVIVEGGENVSNVAWHVAQLADRVLAATYESERQAAIATLRRIAWGRIYRDRVHDASER